MASSILFYNLCSCEIIRIDIQRKPFVPTCTVYVNHVCSICDLISGTHCEIGSITPPLPNMVVLNYPEDGLVPVGTVN